MQFTLVLDNDPTVLTGDWVLFDSKGCTLHDVFVVDHTTGLRDDRNRVWIPRIQGRTGANSLPILHLDRRTEWNLVAFELFTLFVRDDHLTTTGQGDHFPLGVLHLIELAE